MRVRLPEPKLLYYFRFYYRYLGGWIWLTLLSSLLVALLDGFGLAMFLPLLQVAAGPADAAAGTQAEMFFVLEGLRKLGLTVDLPTVLWAILSFFVLKGIARFAMDFFRVVLQQRFADTIRLRNLKLLLECNFAYFSRAHSGKIQNILSGEVQRLRHAYLNYFQLLQYFIMTVVYAGLAYLANPGFAAIVVVGGLLSNLTFVWINRATEDASRRISQGMNSYQGFLIESVASFKFLKATGLINRYRAKIETSMREVERQQRRIGVFNGLATAVREPLVVLVVVSAIVVHTLVFDQPLSLIILSLLFFYRALTSVIAVQNCYNAFLGVAGAITNVESFTQQMQAAQEPPGRCPFTGIQQVIRLDRLSYAYGEQQVLRDLSLTIDKYETVGIVGQSGSGKTTLVNLLCGLLQAAPGMVRVDDTDLNEIAKADYRKRIGYVTQEAQVFSDTIRNNVTFWDPQATQDEPVWEALRLAHAADFVHALPLGLDTPVGLNGLTLSGGQRQRLSIARELYRRVDLLILDEATSALDSESEQSIRQNIESLAGSLTLVVIAHRLSTIRQADQIVLLQPGGAYEIGTFASLQQSSRTFRTMVELQAV